MSHKGLSVIEATEWVGDVKSQRLAAGVDHSLVISTLNAIESPEDMAGRSMSSLQPVATAAMAKIKTLEIVPFGTATIILTLLAKHVKI